MERIDKFIAKLQRELAHDVLDTLRRIRLNDLRNMDIKKLRGSTNEYRVRIGRVRIKFVRSDLLNVVTDIGLRNDNTY